MEMWSWLKTLFTPHKDGSGRPADSQLAWTSSSSRDNDRDLFDDSYFSAPGNQGCSKDADGDSSSSPDCSSDGGSD